MALSKAHWPKATHGYFCSSASQPCQDLVWALASTSGHLGLAALGLPFFSVTHLHLNSPPKKQQHQKTHLLLLWLSSINPEKSVLRAGKTDFHCSHNLLHLFSTAKTQLSENKRKINSFVFSISLSHLFPEALNIYTLGLGAVWVTMPRKRPSFPVILPKRKGGSTST